MARGEDVMSRVGVRMGIDGMGALAEERMGGRGGVRRGRDRDG